LVTPFDVRRSVWQAARARVFLLKRWIPLVTRRSFPVKQSNPLIFSLFAKKRMP